MASGLEKQTGDNLSPVEEGPGRFFRVYIYGQLYDHREEIQL